jgi:hypothetical protein
MGLNALSNTPEDISDLALEMMERTTFPAPLTPEKKQLLRRFNSIIGNSKSYRGAQIGIRFLEKYSYLLDNEKRPATKKKISNVEI